MKCNCRLTFAVFFLASPLSAQTLPADLDRYIEDIRAEWEVIGLAVGVVKDGELIYAKGFGERRLGGGAPVDADTLFAIASNSKAITAAAIGILVDEGKMGWDDRVRTHLPWFELYDPWVTREITVRDLLSHRSGLGRRADNNWYATDFDRKEIVRRIRFLEPDSSFRSQAGYQNTMYLAAGEVTATVAGKSWDDFVTGRILRPLGMNRSRTSIRELEGLDNVASPHARIDDEIVEVSHRNTDNIAPAGSILSSVAEMSRWMRLMLQAGEFEGTRILSEAAAGELLKPNIIYPLPPEWTSLFPSMHISTYGLGWGLHDYRGRLIATHAGGIDGMLSRVLLVPEDALGIIVLTNTSPKGRIAYSTIIYHVLDSFLGAPDEFDWRRRWREVWEQEEQQRADQFQTRNESRAEGTRPSLALERYCGAYENDLYGRIRVDCEDGALVFRRHTGWTGDLEHWHYDTFLVRWRDRIMGESFVSFRLGRDGEAAVMETEILGDLRRAEEGGDASP